jgi:hypothetical protein
VTEGDPIDLVQSVGELDCVVVALRDFLHRSGALRAVAAVDHAVVDCPRFAPVEVERDGHIVALPHGQALDAKPPALPPFDQPPPFEIDPEHGEVRAPLGNLEALGTAVRALACALSPGAVVVASFATTTPGMLLSVSARDGEPVVIALGEEIFELEGC